MTELAPRLGFEPRTWRLTAARSTIELSGNAMVCIRYNFLLYQSFGKRAIRTFVGCRARNRTWVKGFKVLRATSTQRGNFPFYWCRRSGSNRHESRLSTVFETVASANSATPAKLERKTRLELATSSLARRHSTTELLPPALLF